MPDPSPSEFEKAADETAGEGLVSEFFSFLAHNKKWWLLPIAIIMILMGVLFVLASNPVTAPFIYPLF